MKNIPVCMILAAISGAVGFGMIGWGVLAGADVHQGLLLLGLGSLALMGSAGLLFFRALQELKRDIKRLSSTLSDESPASTVHEA